MKIWDGVVPNNTVYRRINVSMYVVGTLEGTGL
jgi:hypothetical protein